MRAVSLGRTRTPTNVRGHGLAATLVGSGRCGIGTDSRGTRRTRTERVKSQLLCQLSYRPSLGAAENSSGPGGEASERVGSPIFVPHSSVNLKVSAIGKRSTHNRRARSFSDQITVRC